MNIIFDVEYRLLHDKQSAIHIASSTKDNMRDPFIVAIGSALNKTNAKFYFDGTEYIILKSRIYRQDMMQIYNQTISKAVTDRMKPPANTQSDYEDEVKWESTKRIRFKDSKVTKAQTRLLPVANKWALPHKRRKSKSIRAWQGGTCTPR